MQISEIPSWIRGERLRQGLKQRELEEQMLAPECIVSWVETGKRKPLSDSALNIIDALGYRLEVRMVRKDEDSGDRESARGNEDREWAKQETACKIIALLSLLCNQD